MTLIRTKGVASGNDDLQTAGILSTTALNKLNMQSPELSRFVVAFKDLSQELPENTGIQVGMIILDVNGRYVYVPVVSKSGNVQILESMFDADTKKFIPLTRKSVDFMINKEYRLGASERIPASVARDPNLYDAIVPPKTGKFAYASEGRLGGFFAMLPALVKEATYNIINNDFEFQQAMAPIMDFDIAKAHLLSVTPAEVEPMGPPAPQVITNADDLTEEQIQEVLAKGYTVRNPPKSKRVAVESSGNQALTTLSALPLGSAAMAMKKNGSWVGVASVKPVPSPTSETMKTNPVTGEAGSNRACTGKGEGLLAITEDGYILTNPKIIVDNANIGYDDVISKVKFKRMNEVNRNDYGMIFTGAGWLGPISVRMVDQANNWTSITAVDDKGVANTISVHPNVKTLYSISGMDVVLSTSAVFYPLKESDDSTMETDINTASMKYEIEMQRLLPYQSTLMHREGVYAVDGKDIGGKPQIVEHLLNAWELDVPSVETFVKKAEEKQTVIVKMAAAVNTGSGTKLSPMYQQGEQLDDSNSQMTGNARQRALGMAQKGKAIKDVADREVMEATIISEMLQNPDLAGSIKEYLPEIKNAVDKLGRSLFLMRINTDTLSENIDAEALNNLFTATRNAYRIVGENCVMLENLAANELE